MLIERPICALCAAALAAACMANEPPVYDEAWLDAAIFGGPPPGAKAPAEDDPLLDEAFLQGLLAPRPWEAEIRFEAGFGYKDNVLLSEIDQRGAPFALARLEGMWLWSPPESASEAMVLAFADTRRFFDFDPLGDETLALLSGRYARAVGPGKLGASLEHVYVKQAFDASFDIDEPLSQVVKANQPALSLFWESAYRGVDYALEYKTGPTLFSQGGDDYWRHAAELEAETSLSEAWRLEGSLEAGRDAYEEALARDLNGFAVAGLERRGDFLRSELALARAFSWLGAEFDVGVAYRREWRFDAHVGYRDRRKERFSLEGDVERGPWSLQASFRLEEEKYPHREALPGELRRDDDFSARLRVERRLFERYELFLEIESSSKDTNEPLSSYDGGSIAIGARLPAWKF